MQIQFFGGAQTVTGSQHLITANGHKVLLECGLFQGRRRDTYEKNLNFEHDPAEVDAVVLSHSHIDHCGNLPNLHRKGFNKKIYATPPAIELASLMLRDSAYLNEKDAEWVNRKRASRGQELIEPLYRIKDAEAVLKQFEALPYYTPKEVAPGVRVTFQDAGHILGSAGVLLEITENGHTTRLGFSGDIGRRSVPILRDPDPVKDLDALIIESTYGDREHIDDSNCERELADLIKYVHKRGGKLIIPAFAVGRTQTLLYKIHRLQEQDRIPRMPMYVDSPMACKATEIFRNNEDVFDKAAYEHFINQKEDPFAPDGFACVTRVDESKKINLSDGPQIIIAASGMMEGGRVLHHLKNNIKDPKNVLLFVGFAAQHTLARRLMDGDKKVKIFGEEYPVKLEIRKMPYFSGHADYHGLMRAVKANSPNKLKSIFLVHGEKSQAEALKERIHEADFETVHIPKRMDAFTIK